LATLETLIPSITFGIPRLYLGLLGFDFMKTICDLSLFNSILFYRHHSSIILIALVKAGLQSARIAISSANTITIMPSI